MKSGGKPIITLSFWCATALALTILAPLAIDLIRGAANIFNFGFLLLPFLPLALVEPAVIIAVVMGVLLRRRLAFYVYMAGIPLAVPSLLIGLNKFFSHEDIIGGSLGYGATSSLVLTLFVMLLVGLVVGLEYIAYHDLRHIPRGATS